MILHCYVCSQGGERITRDSAIAWFEPEKIKVPLDGNMFTGVTPRHPAPWRAGASWDRMFCPASAGDGHSPGGRHLPWRVNPGEIDLLVKRGGPLEIYTQRGPILLLDEGLGPPPPDPGYHPQVYDEDELADEWERRTLGGQIDKPGTDDVPRPKRAKRR